MEGHRSDYLFAKRNMMKNLTASSLIVCLVIPSANTKGCDHCTFNTFTSALSFFWEGWLSVMSIVPARNDEQTRPTAGAEFSHRDHLLSLPYSLERSKEAQTTVFGTKAVATMNLICMFPCRKIIYIYIYC